MNDFLKTLGQFGMEGLGVEDGRELSLEEEMNEEIAMEADLDEAYAQMDYANMVAGASQAEAILTTMADREVGLESNAGRNATDVYKGFGIEVGMEAVKDVVARKAYSGLASLKALINTCIKWLKSLIGIHTASKKIFAGLKKKATAMRKQLSKVQSKVSEKLKREMPDYAKALTTIIADYQLGTGSQKVLGDTLSQTDSQKATALSWSEADVNREIEKAERSINSTKTKKENLKELYDKADTTEYEGSACFTAIYKVLDSIIASSEKNKSDDFQKIVDNNIKSLEKTRSAIDKDKNAKPAPNLSRYFNKRIEAFTKVSGLLKDSLKLYVNVSDDALTMAKGIYATLV